MKRGAFSLALTLWIVAMMGLVSVLYLSYGKKIVTKSTQLHNKLLLTFQAESMVELLKFYGSTGVFNRNYITNGLIEQYYPTFPKKIFIDSTETKWKNVQIILQDTAGLIDIRDNIALTNHIQNSSTLLKDKKDIIKDSLRDWLDTDSFSLLNGAEDLFYKKKYAYGTRDNSYWATKEELLLVRGIEELNQSKQDELLSLIVITDKNKRNLLTLNSDLLQNIYNISSSDLTQLESLKKEENLNRFVEFFNTIYKENYDFERDGATPSKALKIKVICSSENIKKEIIFLIDFSILGQKNFEILNYRD